MPRAQRKSRRPPRAASWESRLLGLVVVTLVVFGVVSIYSASSIIAVNDGRPSTYFALQQLVGAVVGFLILLVSSRIPYTAWQNLAWAMVGVSVLLLLIPLVPVTQGMAPETFGARRWVNLGFGRVQPSEFAKFAIIVWAAMLAAKKGERIREFKTGLLPFAVIVGPVCLLIMLAPDLSTAVLTALLAGVVVFVAGARIGHFMVMGVVLMPFLWTQITRVQYRLQRMITFLSDGTDPLADRGQVAQSIIGFGSGGLLGTGFGEGTQKLGHLPLAYSDFIFSTIGEEWGFFGVTAILFLYGTVAYLGFRIARNCEQPFGKFLATGLTALIAVTALFHVAVNVELVPATGLPLPFISHGRSNLLVGLLAVGVLMNIGNERVNQPT